MNRNNTVSHNGRRVIHNVLNIQQFRFRKTRLEVLLIVFYRPYKISIFSIENLAVERATEALFYERRVMKKKKYMRFHGITSRPVGDRSTDKTRSHRDSIVVSTEN